MGKKNKRVFPHKWDFSDLQQTQELLGELCSDGGSPLVLVFGQEEHGLCV